MSVVCRDWSPRAMQSSIDILVDCGGDRTLLCIGPCAPRISNCARSSSRSSAATSATSARTVPRSCRRWAVPCRCASTVSRDHNCVSSLQLHTRAVSSSTSNAAVRLRDLGWCYCGRCARRVFGSTTSASLRCGRTS